MDRARAPGVIYGLHEKGSHHIRYVGSSTDMMRRMSGHRSEFKNGRLDKCHPKSIWLSKIAHDIGGILCYTILEECPDYYMLPEREAYWIGRLREEGHDLTNVARVDGVEINPLMSFYVTSQVRKALDLAKKQDALTAFDSDTGALLSIIQDYLTYSDLIRKAKAGEDR